MTKKEEALLKRKLKLQEEQKRVYELGEIERHHAQYKFIAGIDEVGRGSVAGPVVAGAVILPKDCEILYINDSKKLSKKKREAIYDEILKKAIATGLGVVPPSRIDEINILQATYEAMRMAIENLSIQPDLLLVDAVQIPDVHIKQVPIVKGDAKSISIAAASIFSKVSRDKMMVAYDELYSGYEFSKNCGYGTKAHLEALREKGVTPIHRLTFISHIIDNHDERK